MTEIINFFELFVLDVVISWHYNVNYEAGLLLAANQHNVRQILKQMLVGLDREVPEDLCVMASDYSFGSTHHSLLCSWLNSAHIALYTIETTLLCFPVYSVPASLLRSLII